MLTLNAAGQSRSKTQSVRSGEDTLRIGIQDAVIIGLENNPTVTIQRIKPEIMQTYVGEQRAAFDPSVTVSGQRTTTSSLRRLGAARTPFAYEEERFDVNAGVTGFLPTGTVLSLTSGMTGSVSNLYTDQYAGTIGLTVTQSLLQGFGFKSNLIGLRKARLDWDISRSELQGIAENVIADIEQSYWTLYLTDQEVKIQNRSLELARQQLIESAERVKVGRLPELELAAVEAELAVRQSALIDAQSRYEQARLRFLYLLNPRQDSLWYKTPVPLDSPFLPTDTLDVIQTHVAISLKCRPDLQQARLQLAKCQLEVARTRNGLLPRLDVFISLGRTAYAESFKEATPDVTSPYYQANAGLNFALPVPNRQAQAQNRRARLDHEQQALAVANLEKLVQLDVHTTYTEVLRARQQIEATRITRELQAKKSDAELEKFRVGKSTNLLVLQTQRDYTASQLDEARALVTYLNALVELYLTEGSLLERRGIDNFSE